MEKNDDAVLAVTGGTAHGTTIVNLSFHDSGVVTGFLPRHDRKPHPVGFVSADEFFNFRRVDGRTVRASVEFGLNP